MVPRLARHGKGQFSGMTSTFRNRMAIAATSNNRHIERMQSPVVSVVMPVRDGAQFIDEAIGSIRIQTLSHLELIVVDDGSSDASAVIAARHAAADDRIRILTLPPSGSAIAFNHGLAAARGDYVARFAADAVAEPEWLERQVAAGMLMRREAALVAATTADKAQNANGRREAGH